jgi:HD-like signal output (HDOD) protein
MRLRDLLQRRPAAAIPPGSRKGVEFLTRITAELADGPLNLPCFPDIVPRVRRALDDPDSTADDIVKIAGTEPRLAARLLQTASSAVFNPAGRPTPHLRAAVTRLGHQAVQSVAMVFAVQQMKNEATLRPVVQPLLALWEKSIAVASICQVLANLLRVPADKVFLVGLLHGIGHFYIIVRTVQPGSGMSYDALPAELVAERHPAIGRAVLAKWGFEPIVCEAVGLQLDHARQSMRAADITDVLVAGVVLAEILLQRTGDLSRTGSITAFARLGLDATALHAVLRHTEHSIGAIRDTLAC